MAVEDDIVVLSRVATVRVLGREAMRIIAISAQSVRLAGGETLFEEGEPADAGYVVIFGSIELKGTQDHVAGGSAIARSGALIGETALIIEALRPATATALEATSLLKIPRSVFLRTLEGEPGAAVALRDMMRGRLASTLHDLDIVSPLFAGADGDEDNASQH
jgi:CRP-like cAMP-binding protein